MRKMICIRRQFIEICHPLVMGIVNATPDSFARHCARLDEPSVLNECEQLLNQGADWLDVGACSTRPGSKPVDEKEEIQRLDIALSAIKNAYPQVPVSVDTFRANVAEYVVENYGADIINDVSGLHDEAMIDVLARTRVPYIFTYPGEPGAEMLSFFATQLDKLHRAGVKDVIIDPGIGFGKTLEQNYQCLRELDILQHLGCPIMVGLSRKSMVYTPLNLTPNEALNGTTAAHMLALTHGANILRVHDVKEAKQTIKIWQNCYR